MFTTQNEIKYLATKELLSFIPNSNVTTVHHLLTLFMGYGVLE